MSELLAGPRRVAKRAALSSCGVVSTIPREQGLLLTFDDGPCGEVTRGVLERLAQYDAKAIFFVVGNRIGDDGNILRGMIDEGHRIGNHTFSHPLQGRPSLPEYCRDVAHCQQTVASLVGQPPRWFRPPLGSVTLGSLLAPRRAGLRTMLWSVDVGDWRVRSDADAAATGERLAGVAVPGDVVLLHDDNPYVLPLLDSALPRLRQRGVPLAGALTMRFLDGVLTEQRAGG